ncbi:MULTISPECIES: condensation domain-containing protein [Dickeya]|uniref:condensation domain-containing protein n=1 Tax=Dickeya TaxID=204037 RepID=UPI0003A40A47|nr:MULTISPECIES: condensation domain-containing protein [Dickeya]UGA52378.1 condensation domain-containing protein [Dickeya fangzhongdai]UWH08723.1 condensation protein [Dickeya fangzhongdai]
MSSLNSFSASSEHVVNAAASGAAVPLVYAQHCFWFVAMTLGDTANNQSGILIEGDLQPELLEKALNCLIHRHSSLRMAFSHWTPVQQCRAFHGFDLSVIKLDGCGEEERRRRVSDISARFMAQPFALDKPPHLRAQLFQLQPQRYLLLLSMPHIIADGGAFHLFEQQLWQVYSALNAGRTPHDNQDATPIEQWVAQERVQSDEALQAELAFWRQHLAGYRYAHFPLSLINQRELIDHQCDIPLADSDMERIKQLARQHRMSVQMVLLAIVGQVVNQLSGESRFALNSVLEGRNQPGSETLMAPQLRAMPVPMDFSRQPDLAALLEQVRQNVLQAYEHMHSWSLPIGILARQRWSHSPRFLVTGIEWLSRLYCGIARKARLYPRFLADFLFMEPKPPRWWWARDPAWRAKGVADPLININVLQDAFKTDAPQAQSATLAIRHCRESDYFTDADIATRWESDTINIYITRGADRQLKLHITCCCFNQDGMDRFLQLLRQQLSSLG